MVANKGGLQHCISDWISSEASQGKCPMCRQRTSFLLCLISSLLTLEQLSKNAWPTLPPRPRAALRPPARAGRRGRLLLLLLLLLLGPEELYWLNDLIEMSGDCLLRWRSSMARTAHRIRPLMAYY